MEIFRQHPHWRGTLEVAKRLQEAGFRAYLAGGCVRDGLLGRMPKDFDIATDAKPDQVEVVFSNAIPVGKAFGVMRVPVEDFQIEVATLRKDGPYEDGRHPKHVQFAGLKEDAERRDFTINALFFDIKSEKILDYVDGQKDLKRQLIRTVGRAQERFEEDKLRPLRAVRFAAQLGFAIETETLKAVAEFAPRVQIVSAERIQEEWKRLLASPGKVRGMRLFEDTGLRAAIWPDYRELEGGARTEQIFEVLLSLAEQTEFAVNLAALQMFETMDPPKVVQRLRKLKCSNEVIRRVQYLLAGLHVLRDPQRNRLGRRLRLLGSEDRAYLIQLATLDVETRNSGDTELEALLKRYQEIQEDGELPRPWLDGTDLLNLKKTQGPQLGALLEELYDLQLEGEIQSRAQALERVTKD